MDLEPPKRPIITIDLPVDEQIARDALRATLHTILFHRLFGTIKPRNFEVLDVTLPGVKDPETEALVESKVETFVTAMTAAQAPQTSGQVSIIWSEKRPKKQWFYVAEEEVSWEEWVINLDFRQPRNESERLSLHTTLAKQLTAAVQKTLTYTSSEKGRAAVPLISTAQGISPFPFNIVVKVGGVEV